MRVYISGPITGVSDYLEKFNAAEEELKAKGYEVINPAKLNSIMPETLTYEEFMKFDYEYLEICDAIYLLKGWNMSSGSKLELNHYLNQFSTNRAEYTDFVKIIVQE